MTIDSVTAIQNIGFFNDWIAKSLEAGKKDEGKEDIKVRLVIEEEKRKVQPIYSSRRKFIEYKERGEFVNILA